MLSDDPGLFTCFSSFIPDQVLEAHGLKPISLKPKEVMLKKKEKLIYLICLHCCDLTQSSLITDFEA